MNTEKRSDVERNMDVERVSRILRFLGETVSRPGGLCLSGTAAAGLGDILHRCEKDLEKDGV